MGNCHEWEGWSGNKNHLGQVMFDKPKAGGEEGFCGLFWWFRAGQWLGERPSGK